MQFVAPVDVKREFLEAIAQVANPSGVLPSQEGIFAHLKNKAADMKNVNRWSSPTSCFGQSQPGWPAASSVHGHVVLQARREIARFRINEFVN
jgi:hypothetical protein